ncbi:hypothetical protein BKA63DRAFT_602967 [Paraphoma chrysanthemicola]|nr:hypothetical protein BKA63DRAFT_602967 [Paraphoma chrysanthemicola]
MSASSSSASAHLASHDSLSPQDLLGSSFGAPVDSTYDYVIVGGGTAGLVLANRLSVSHTVAVIEAGSFYEIDNGNLSQIPRYVWSGADTRFDDVNPLVDWNFGTEPEAGLGGAKIHYTRGKTLGGCSARNHMIYHLPTEESLDKWAEDVDDEAYRWENFTKYYDSSTTFNNADMTKRPANSTPPHEPAAQRNITGPVQLSYANYVLPFTSWAMKAAESLGMKQIPGYLGGHLLGSAWHVQTTDPKTMVRDSSETAYLRPALKHPNLMVHQSTMALKVLFNGTEAVGVECSADGKRFTLKARNEVILSAGAIQSPQLLMVSGVGPRETLEKFGIEVLVDAPGVGQGLEDHPAVAVTYKVRVESSTILDTPEKQAAATQDFLNNGAGPLTSTGLDILAWEKLPTHLLAHPNLSAPTPDWPDIEYLTSSIYPGLPPDKDDYAGLFAVLVNTFSRGTISLRSASMLDPPLVHINFLTDPRDKAIAIASIRRMREIFTHPSLVDVVVPGSEVAPGPEIQTDEEILGYIKVSARTISHASSTCRMGKKGDRTAVVDSAGRVFGTKRLRVADLSSVPFLTPGHPMGTVYALAEFMSERILGDFRL